MVAYKTHYVEQEEGNLTVRGQGGTSNNFLLRTKYSRLGAGHVKDVVKLPEAFRA